MKSVRVATVKATGSRYVVQQVDFRAEKVHCWGEVMFASSTKGTKHEGAKFFLLNEVDINEVPFDQKLKDELFEQSAKAHPDARISVRVSTRR